MENKISTKKKVLLIISTIFIAIANIALAVFVAMIWQYKNLASEAFYFVVGALACILLILDVILIFMFKYKIKSTMIVGLIFALLLSGACGAGLFVANKLNSTFNNIVDTTEEEQYETIRVSFVTYDNNTINSLVDLDGKKVGSLQVGSGVSSASVGRDYLTSKGIEPKYQSFDTTTSLFEALIAKDIDVAIFSNVFKTQLSNDGFDEYLEKTNIIDTYEEKVKTTDEESSKKDITVEPFTVLLIGYAPEEGGGGLTDTIILASINPSTMQVLLTSIPRDSYVPISCYGGTKSKINDAGAASNACLMETVEDLMGVNVDFYMKVNFQGVVDIVDAVGGIDIDSPVEFVGQSSSSERGHYTVWIPQGYYHANGEEALAFARERHAMPNGDFDRQIHQQEVIQEIAKKLLNLSSVSEALEVLKVAGDNFTTNLSIDQLTSVFNYIVNAPNYSNINQFDMIDIMNSRLTGYAYWFYSYSMRLPLWSYQLYNGSIKENVNLSKSVLNEFDKIEQAKGFQFFEKYPYIKGQVYSDYFDEAREPENMPPYYPNLVGMSLAEATVWANANGVKFNITYIKPGEDGYDANSLGIITTQSPRYGALVEEYPIGQITVIGQPVPLEYQLPDFKNYTITYTRNWLKNHGILDIKENIIDNTDSSLSGLVASQSVDAGTDYTTITSITIDYYKVVVISTDALQKGVTTEEECKTWAKNNLNTEPIIEYQSSTKYKNGTLIGFDYDTEQPTANSTFTFYICKEDEKCEHEYELISTTQPSDNQPGIKTYRCKKCDEEKTEYYCADGYEYVEGGFFTKGSCKIITVDPGDEEEENPE